MASRLRRRAPRVALALAGALISGTAGAQEAPPDDSGEIVLDTIEVNAAGGLAAGTTEGTGLYTPVASTTATKFALTPRETPQTIAVVTNQVIEDFSLTDMRDVLETAPFIDVYTERSPGTCSFTTRGTEDMNVQFDGIPGPSSICDRGAMPFDTAFIDRTEIVYGAQGLLGGAGGAGGTINIVRKMPTTAFQAAGDAGVDERGSYRLVGDVSGPFTPSGSVRGRLIGVVDDQQSFVDEAWTRTNSIYGVVEADVREGTTVTLGGLYVDYEAATGAAYGNPTMVDGSFVDLPRSTNLGADWGRDDRRGGSAFLRLDQDLPGDWELRGALNYVHSSSRLTESIPQGPFFPGTDYEYVVQAQKEGWDNTAWGLDGYAAGSARLFGRTHELMVGVSALRDEGHSIGGYWVEGIPNDRGEWSVVEVSHAFDHDPTSVPQPADDDWFEVWGPFDWTTQQFGTYAAGRFSLADPTHLILGARATWWRYSDDSADTMRDDAVTPYAALTWDFSDWGTAYASYASIFDPSMAMDANFRILPATEGHNYEVGLKGSFFGGRLDASLALYRLDQTNLPVEDYDGPLACNGWYCFTASGQVITDGVDIGLSGQVTPDWNVLAGYSYNSSEITADASPYASYYPDHQFKLSTTYALPGDRWTFGGQLLWQSEIYDAGVYETAEGGVPYRVEQPAYTVVNLMARYRINDRAELRLNVENLFDETYYDGISYPRHGNTYGAPRTAGLTLRATF